MADNSTNPARDGTRLLDEMSHWAGVIGQAQMMLMEHGAAAALQAADQVAATMRAQPSASADPTRMWSEGLALWRSLLPDTPAAPGDRRFTAPEWQQPVFDLIRQSYSTIAARMLDGVDQLDGLDPQAKQQVAFATRAFIDALSPSNFAATNPQVVARIMETRGQNLLTGLERMLTDATEGQLRHVGKDAFEPGRNVAVTPGKVIYENHLFQLIHYQPTTENVQATPLLIFPPWINRFYILDLSPQKSFVRWAVEQGLSVFMVSWKSADSSMIDIGMDDYILHGQWEAIEVVTRLLEVPSTHVVGYCVAGTALSMLLAWAAATGHADKVASATFFTAQVDFSAAGELSLFVNDTQIALLEQLAPEGVTDGRIMAATFNALRGRDLIWNYVVNHYLLAEDYPPFDLLHWNSDVTNLPGQWHRRYLTDFYRDNLLVRPGALDVADVPIDLGRIKTPSYVQAGREDHIAPPESVWKVTHHFTGPLRFVLAGSGHIAGVVNPPSANKYQYWSNEQPAETLEEFVAGATEHKGSWWPDWLRWITERSGGDVPVVDARVPGQGLLEAIEDAPGRYVRMR